MNETSITQYITDTFHGADLVVASGDTFFFYYPDRTLPPDYRFPFVTLVTSDINDQFSDLNRPSVFRLNIGVSKKTYRSLFGAGGGDDSAYDFTALDQLMPHPVYGRMYWVCVLNPSDATFQEVVRPLLVEAFDMTVGRFARRAARG